MLDHCSISHKGGLVLWARSFTPAASKLSTTAASPVNNLVREALIEGRTAEDKYEKDGYSIKWTFANEMGLIFVIAYQRILHLTYVEDLLQAMKELFIKLFTPFLLAFVQSLTTKTVEASKALTVGGAWDFAAAFAGWNGVFDKLLKRFEDKAADERKSRSKAVARPVQTPTPPSDEADNAPSQAHVDASDAEAIARNVQALKGRLKGKKKGMRVTSGYSTPASGTDTDTPKRKASKTMRKWGDTNPTADDMAQLDFSEDKPSDSGKSVDSAFLKSLVDEHSRGARTKDGLYEIKDLDMNLGTLDKAAADSAIDDVFNRTAAGKAALAEPSTSTAASTLSAFTGLFSRITGSKPLSKEELAPILSGMKDHLMKKNVAVDIANKICEGVGDSLVGKRVGGFGGIKTHVRGALSDAITRILTPSTSTDMLLAIRNKRAEFNPAVSDKRTPYTMTFVGVNGVGKSTNLSKVCFWLLQNNFRVLIAACDTFRSGAVEQLRVHVRNLSLLAEQTNMGKGGVELYERGYGKDAAGIAKEAISYAKENEFDVVLIDTAGRMQDNEPLMKALAKLVAVNNPDKIIFVGEALVGNEATDQLTKFDRSLKEFSSTAGRPGRGIDGMLVTKWDTVDDKVGAALSMTYVTGKPILFVGCGQTYTDLRQLRVAHVVQALLTFPPNYLCTLMYSLAPVLRRRLIRTASFSTTATRKMQIIPVPNQSDNYAYLLVDEQTKEAAAIDIFDVPKVTAKAKEENVNITSLLTTHHHRDHSGGNAAFAKQYPGIKIYGGSSKCPAMTDEVKDGDTLKVGANITIKCMATPCHTQDSICYYVTDSKTNQRGVFTGDTLFIGGCGRFFEGTGAEMHKALSYLGTLPDDTLTYPGHEYTASNFKFGISVEPENEVIKKGIKLAEENEITTGLTTIGDEKQFNVFMRLDNEVVKKATGESQPDSVMDKLRTMKNNS